MPLSVQCLSEFYRVSTQRLPEPLTPADALAEVERLVAALEDLTTAQAAQEADELSQVKA